MGMPINSYSILKTLAMGGEDYEVEEVKSALEPFTLFAFILHDPQAHSDFHQRLTDLFERLDYVTGDKLLFFALIDPPSSWMQRAKGREYYQKISNWETRAILDPNEAPQSTDPSLTMFAFMNSLGISMNELPCVVITSNFNSQNYYHFPVHQNSIVEQLTELGFVAEKLDPQTANQKNIHEILRAYGFRPKGGSEQELTSNLAKTLSDALSFIIAASPRSEFHQRASGQAKKSVQELYKTLNQMKSTQPEEPNQDLDQLATTILSFMALLNQKPNSPQQDIVPIERKLLEYESYQILRTASKVYELLMSDQGRDIDSVLEMTDDFSPGVIALSKVFEREVNLSMVHWARKQLGISLPEFYNRAQPGKNAVRGIANFNQERKGRWLPPGIGQSEKAISSLAKESLPGGWDEVSYNFLMERWSLIREKRNNAAHSGITDMQSLLVVQGALTDLAQNKCFDKFYEMKLAYSGRTHAS
jgi:hypothetical protein